MSQPTNQNGTQPADAQTEKPDANQNGTQPADATTQTIVASTTGTQQTTAARTAPPMGDTRWAQDPTVAAINAAFLLGWHLTELRSRIALADKLVVGGFDPASDPLWLASVWRATFSEIAVLHVQVFPNKSTANSFYEPQGGWASLMGYLFKDKPDPATPDYTQPAYTNIGLQAPITLADKTTTDLKDFALYDVTRRALNALILLHANLDHDKPLLMEVIQNYRDNLIAAMQTPPPSDPASGTQGVQPNQAAPAPDGTPPAAVAPATSGAPAPDGTPPAASNTPADPITQPPLSDQKAHVTATGIGGKPDPDLHAIVDAQGGEAKRRAAIHKLSADLVQLLAAWDSFLRENFYTGGMTPNDPTEQMAYEAGSSLAGLSWDLAVQSQVDLIKAEQALEAQLLKESGTKAKDALNKVHNPILYAYWYTAFDQRKIVHIQHQIDSISTVLDSRYYAVYNVPQPTPLGSGEVVFDLARPSAMLQSVSRSLDLWQRAIYWLNPLPTPPVPTPSATKPQSGGPTLLTRIGRLFARPAVLPQRAPTHVMSVPMARLLNTALIEQSDVWQMLVTGQQSLSAFSVETVMHAVVQDVINEFHAAIQKSVRGSVGQAIGDVFRQLWPIIALILLLAVPGVVALYIIKPTFSNDLNPNGLWGVLGVGPLIAGLLGFRSLANGRTAAPASAATGAASTTPATGGVAALAQLGAIGLVGTVFFEVLQSAWKQIGTDLAVFNHEIGVAYPLLECFVNSPLIADVDSDYQFMTQVIWSDSDRKQEVEGVVRSALGPVALLFTTQTKKSGS